MIRTRLAREVAEIISESIPDGPGFSAAVAALIDARILGPLSERAHTIGDRRRLDCVLCDNWPCTCPEFAPAPEDKP